MPSTRFLAACLLAVLSLCVSAGDGPSSALRIPPSDSDWQGSQLLPNGVQVKLLMGDPKSAGLYAMRVKIPAHTRIPPQAHPDATRTVTVISGTLYLGFGRKFDADRLHAMTPGTFFTEPKDEPHFALAGREDVILHLVAVGPSGTQYVEERPSE